MRGLFAFLALLLMVAEPVQAAKRETLEQRIEALMPGIDVYLPEGDGPFPVFVQFHGCGGKKKMQADYAQVAREMGWAAIVVDSYMHRNISRIEAYATVCTGLQFWGRKRAGDLYAAMEFARRQPWGDKGRIALGGWSHGGWTVLDAMTLKPGLEAEKATGLSGLPAEPLDGLVGAFVVYPYSGPGSLAPSRGLRIDVGPKALVGLSDVIVGARGLASTLRKTRTPGRPIDVVELEGATHAFDEPDTRDLRVRYNPELTARAQQMLRDYLSSVSSPAK